MSDPQSNAIPASSMDTELGRMVVERNLATPDEVGHCQEMQKQGTEPANRSLAALLVDEGYVTARQIDRLKQAIEPPQGSRQIPGYQIMEKIGAGAMARVYRARQLSLDRTVAIKVLSKRLSESPDYVQRFYKEGKAAAQLNHANIVGAYDVGEANGVHYFVMEYVEGYTVADKLVGGGRYDEAEALDIVVQIARALQHAHERGFIHRDVKPKNIMITPDGVAKLADMGLAREARDVQAAQAEQGRAFGTPYYISPEQIRGDLDVDFRADIYGLGATFYHMVTGRVPFDAETPAAVMHKHLKEPLVPPDHINTELSNGVGEVIEVMMAKNRNHRYASTADLLLDLEAIQRGEPPLQARKMIDADVLGGLAAEAEGASSEDTIIQPAIRPASPLSTAVILLAAGLAISVLLNIILLLGR